MKSLKWKKYCKITDAESIVTPEEVAKAVDGHELHYKKIMRSAIKGTELETSNAVYIKQ